MSDCNLFSLGVRCDLICKVEVGESAGMTHVTTSSTEIQLRPAGAYTHHSALTQHGLRSHLTTACVPGHKRECQSLLSRHRLRLQAWMVFSEFVGRRSLQIGGLANPLVCLLLYASSNWPNFGKKSDFAEIKVQTITWGSVLDVKCGYLNFRHWMITPWTLEIRIKH